MFRHYRWRIAIPYSLLFLLILASLGIFLTRAIRQKEIQNLEETTTVDAILLSDYLNATYSNAPNSTEQLDLIAKRWAGILNSRVTIIAADGSVLSESHADRFEMDNHLGRPEVQQALIDGIGSSTRFSRSEGREFLYVAVPYSSGDQIFGFVRLSIPIEQANAEISTVIQPLIIAIVIATILSISLAGYLSRPIRKLNEAVKSDSLEKLHLEPFPIHQDEIEQLGSIFDTIVRHFQEQISYLKSEQRKLESVLEQLTDGVIIVGSAGTVQLINPAALKLFGISQSIALGHSLTQVTRHHQIIDLWKQTLNGAAGKVVSIEIPARRLSLSAIGIPLIQYPRGSVLLVFQDVSHVRHLETVRRDFISNISHELRTPLASLKALTETLQDGALEDHSVARHFLTRMDTEVDSLALIVQELLELSRIESGKVPLNLEEISPDKLISPAVDRLRLQAERNGLALKVELQDDLPNILADPIRMQQVFVNLVHNAIKFTPLGGEISISAQPKGESLIFSIKDTGIGISEHDMPRIFERFFKADRARSGGGTGLGLAIARHLVEAHSGRIWAESQEGKGSTFFFSLPRVS